MEQLNITLFLYTAGGLFAFGVGYNLLVGWLHDQGFDGYVAIEVVAGVLVTIVGLGVVLGERVAEVALLLFAASGLPMTAGDIWRTWQRQRREREKMRRDAEELRNVAKEYLKNAETTTESPSQS